MGCRCFPAPQVSLSKPAGLSASKAPVARAPVARAVSCSAEKKEASTVAGVAAAALALTFSFGAVDAAYADVAGLTPCSESKAFAKRKKNEVCSRGRPGAAYRSPICGTILPQSVRKSKSRSKPKRAVPAPIKPRLHFSCCAGQGPEQAPQEREWII